MLVATETTKFRFPVLKKLKDAGDPNFSEDIHDLPVLCGKKSVIYQLEN